MASYTSEMIQWRHPNSHQCLKLLTWITNLELLCLLLHLLSWLELVTVNSDPWFFSTFQQLFYLSDTVVRSALSCLLNICYVNAGNIFLKIDQLQSCLTSRLVYLMGSGTNSPVNTYKGNLSEGNSPIAIFGYVSVDSTKIDTYFFF